jgi:hypothetical protein
MKEVGTCEPWGEKSKPEWKNADYADFLSITDLFRALELGAVKNNKEKEKIVRQRIWWTFNDRIREHKNYFIREEEENLWKQNCQRLIELFDTTDESQKIMTAELHRNLGEFDVCMEIINTLDKNFDWIVERFKVECDNRNKALIKLR